MCLVPLLRQGVADILDDPASGAHGMMGRVGALRQGAVGRIGQEIPQRRHTLGRGAGEIDLLCLQRGVDHHLLTGAGDRHIQPPPAAFPVERSEIHGDTALGIRPVADGEENYIPLVTLDIFQIFDEQRLLRVVGPLFQHGVGGAGLVQQVVDKRLLIDVEGHHAHARLRQSGIMSPAGQLSHYRLGLGTVLPGLAPVKEAAHMDQAHHALSVVDRRERVKPVFIELPVGEGDQALMPAAVVPEQVALGHIEGQAVVQNTFQILLVQMFLVHRAAAEKAGGRHLFGVSHNHRVFPPGQSAHRLAGGQLGCLVKDHQIKGGMLGVQILSHRQRAHEHTGAQKGQQSGDLVEQLSDADAPSPAADGPLQNANFRIVGGSFGKVGHTGGQAAENLRLGQCEELFIQLPELVDLFVEHGP